VSGKKIITSRILLKQSAVEYKQKWWSFARIILLVEVPILIFGFSSTADPAFEAYSSVIILIMNMALLKTIHLRIEDDRRLTLKKAFYDGTSRFVPFALVSIMLLIAFLPALLGLQIFNYSLVTDGGLMAPVGQQAMGALIWLVFSIPTIWIGVRWVFAPYGVLFEGLDPIAAIKYSRQLTLQRYWKTLGRIVVIFVTSLAVGLCVAIPTVLLANLTGFQTLLSSIFQLIALCTILPLMQIYLINLFTDLKSK
jgi:hypothetical protein